MVPTLRHGDVVLARTVSRRQMGSDRSQRPADRLTGRVVLARFRSMPDRLVVKRVVRAGGAVPDAGWWLASDNPFAGGDSERHGVADVHARVLLRVRRHPPGVARVR